MRGSHQCSKKGSGEGEVTRGKEDEKRSLLGNTLGPYFFTKGTGPKIADEPKGFSSTMVLCNPRELDKSGVHETHLGPIAVYSASREPSVLEPTGVSLCRFKKIIPIPEQSMVQMLCHLLECLLTKEDIPEDSPKETYELYFVFAAIWAFGGAMVQDQVRGGAEVDTHIQSTVAKTDLPAKVRKVGQLNVRINMKASNCFVLYSLFF